MKTGTIVLIIVLLVLIAAVVALYFVGKKAQKKQEEKKISFEKREDKPQNGIVYLDNPKQFYGRRTDFQGVKSMISVSPDDNEICCWGEVFGKEIRTINTKRGESNILSFAFSDYTNSINCSMFVDPKKMDTVAEVKDGNFLLIRGFYEFDNYKKDFILKPNAMAVLQSYKETADYEGDRRVELHCHTTLRVAHPERQFGFTLRLLEASGEFLSQLCCEVLDEDVDVHLLDVLVAQVLQLHNLVYLCLQLLLIVGFGTHRALNHKVVALEEEWTELLVVLAEERKLVRALVVLHRELAPMTARLGGLLLYGGDHASHSDLLTVEWLEIRQIAEVELAHMVDNDLVLVERVRREEHSDVLALLVQDLQLIPVLGNGRRRRLNINHRAAAEEALLRIQALLLHALAIAHKLLDER